MLRNSRARCLHIELTLRLRTPLAGEPRHEPGQVNNFFDTLIYEQDPR